MDSLFERISVSQDVVTKELVDNTDIEKVNFNQFLTKKDLVEAGRKLMVGAIYCLVSNGKSALIEYDLGGVVAVTDATLLSFSPHSTLFRVNRTGAKFSVPTSAFLTGEVTIAPATEENVLDVMDDYPYLKHGYLADFDGLLAFESEKSFYEDMLSNGINLND